MAISTYGITLKWGATAGAMTKTIDIKDFPDLGGAPELLETTTLSDKIQTNILGIQSLDALEFTYNGTKDDYDAVETSSRTPLFYEITFTDGMAFTWQGEHTTWITGGGVNAVVEAKISIAASTEITPKA